MGDNTLNGRTYTYSNGETGRWKIYERYEFQKNGNVLNVKEVGTSSTFDTKGCALYYTLEGNKLTIYHGVKGWKAEVRNTVYSEGIYDSEANTITIGEQVFRE